MAGNLANLSVWLIGAVHGTDKSNVPKPLILGSVAISTVWHVVGGIHPKVSTYDIPILFALSAALSSSIFCIGSFVGQAVTSEKRN